MGNIRLHGQRKRLRDQAVRDFAQEYPQLTLKEIAERFGLKSHATISEILRK